MNLDKMQAVSTRNIIMEDHWDARSKCTVDHLCIWLTLENFYLRMNNRSNSYYKRGYVSFLVLISTGSPWQGLGILGIHGFFMTVDPMGRNTRECKLVLAEGGYRKFDKSAQGIWEALCYSSFLPKYRYILYNTNSTTKYIYVSTLKNKNTWD